jgi:molecular chaperone GrpE
MTTPQNPANENIASASTGEDSTQNPMGADIQAAVEGIAMAQKEAEILQLQEEIAKLKDQWVRSVAEADNIRKRSLKEKEETAKYAINAFASDMVTVLETLKRASESIPAAARAENELLKTIGQGVDLTLQELLTIFQRYQINRIDPIDQKFDHNFHQAVAQVERDDVPAGTVVQVVQAGYVIHDRLLRPAMVVVSKAVEPPKRVDTTA